jgi:hypothetical protein
MSRSTVLTAVWHTPTVLGRLQASKKRLPHSMYTTFCGNLKVSYVGKSGGHGIRLRAGSNHVCRPSVIWNNIIYLLISIGLSPGGSSTVHIYTQTIHRTTQNKQYIEQHKNFRRVWAVPRLCGLYPGICHTTEEKARKNLSQGSKNLSHGSKNLSQVNKNLSQSILMCCKCTVVSLICFKNWTILVIIRLY